MFVQIQNFYVTEVLNDTIFILYITSVIVDILTGNAVALYKRKWTSSIGINGTIRHLALFSVMGLLLPIITFATNIPTIANGVMLYVIAQYTISILENLTGMGVNIDKGFTKYFEFLSPTDREAKQQNKKGK